MIAMIGTANLRSSALLVLFLLLLAPVAHAQTGQLTGTVTDSSSGDTLPGVNIVVEGTSQGASTGADGTYTIADLEPGTYTLSASFVGYLTKTRSGVVVQAGETTQADFALAQESVGLEEVVVVGYGEQAETDVTGSVSSIDGEELDRIPTSSATQALQGQLAGVQVVPNAGGAPGGGATVRIRGVGTLGDASPLFVVDGVLTNDISFLNTSDIQSVSVLKDASATAIYGSRGANGVVVIETKTGNLNQGVTFNASAYYGMQDVMDRIELTNAQQYATLANEVAANEGREVPFEDPSSFGAGTDWQDEVFRSAPIQNYQLSARGGTDNITYNFSGNFIREEGLLEKSDFSRATLRLNNTYALNDAIELGHNIAFTLRQGTDANNGLITAAYRADPTIDPRNEAEEFSPAGARASAGNPAASLFYYRNDVSGRRLVGNFYAEANFLDHFTLKSDISLDLDRSETKNFTPEFFVSPTQQTDRNSLNVREVQEAYWQWENTLKYEQAFGDHSFDVLAGLTAQEFTNEESGGTRFNLPGEDESLWFLSTGETAGQTNFGTSFDWAILSALARANYSYLDRYLLTATFRADGSSRFGENNRYGYFPSFAAGWRVAEEPFMDAVDFVDRLKLRASWGIVGNDQIGAYPGIPLVTGNLNGIFGSPGNIEFGATLAELANPNIKWEETRQTDVGVDLEVFENRLTAGLDYYRRTTDGILVQVPIPDYVGVNAPPTVNAAEVLNTGFDLSLDWRQTLSDSDFSYGIGVTASTVNNEVQSLGQGREEILAGGLVNEINSTTRTLPGQPIGAFFGYEVAGVWQTQEEIDNNPSMDGVVPGDLRFRDLNGTDEQGNLTGEPDGTITSADRTFIGSPIPDFIYGFNLRLGYKGFDLNAQFSGQTGNEIFNAKRAVRFGTENFQESALDRWTGPGTSNTQPRVTNAGHNFLPSEFLLEDGSFLKLRNIQLGYVLPSSLTESVRVERARFYVSATNFFTLTDYSGYTPEIPNGNVLASSIDRGVYPLARTLTFGVQTTF